MIEYKKFILNILKYFIFYILHNLDRAYFESFVDDNKIVMKNISQIIQDKQNYCQCLRVL